VRSRPLAQTEFVALIAVVISTAAFSVDTMLPALPNIARALTPQDINRAQFVVTAFIVGLGIGTLFVGPISDAFGRKPVLVASALLSITGAVLSFTAPSLEFLIAARVLHGLGAAGPRALAVAIVRDLYEGRRMAQIMSFVLMVFSLVPAVAPLTGSFIATAFGWRGIFIGFALWTAFATIWLVLRQPETLPRERRVRMAMEPIMEGLRQIIGNRVVVASILALSLNFAMLFAMLVSVQQIFDITFGRGEAFPWWFALTALIAISGSILNARLVIRLGMRFMVSGAFGIQALLSGVLALINMSGLMPDALAFPAYYVWMTSVFWMMGLTIGNLNALALEPMGNHAGLAASVVSAGATILSVIFAAPIGLAFDGTPVPSMVGIFLCAFAALGAMWFTRGPKPGVAPA